MTTDYYYFYSAVPLLLDSDDIVFMQRQILWFLFVKFDIFDSIKFCCDIVSE